MRTKRRDRKNSEANEGGKGGQHCGPLPNNTQKYQGWFWNNPNSVGRFTGWVAVFTALIFVVALGQACEFVLSERAFISFTNFKLENTFIEADKSLKILVEAKNSGKSTAIVTSTNVNGIIIRVAPLKLPETPDYTQGLQNFRVMPLSPGDPYPFDLLLKQPTPSGGMSQTDVDRINGGTAQFYIWGFIKYHDRIWPFWDSTYPFCYFYDTSRKQDPSFGMFTICDNPAYL